MPVKFSGLHRFIEEVPPTNQAEWLALVKKYHVAVRRVPWELMTEEIAFEAVSANPYNIAHCPPRTITERVAIAAVRGNGFVMHCLPESKLTDAVVEAAAKADKFSLEIVKDKEQFVRIAEKLSIEYEI